MDIFLATLSPMLVMFVCLASGFILKKAKLLPDDAGTVMSKLENYIFVPALIISTFISNCTVTSLRENANLTVYSLVIFIFALGLSFALVNIFALKDNYQKNIYKYALTFGNFGFMGNAIVPAILGSVFGENILYNYLLFTLPLQIAVNTWGIYVLIPKENRKGSPAKKLLNPVFFSILIGIVLGLTGIGKILPDFVITSLDYAKNCMAPVAMILTGFIVGGYSFNDLLKNKKVYVASLFRLIIIPAIIIAILIIIKASNLVVLFAVFAYATPLGMNTVIFPAAYGGDTKTGAAMAMVSNVISIVSIPLVYTIVTLII